MSLNIAVVGAGVSGLSCARQLVAGGHQVTVFEKSRGVGGRAPTRWVDRTANPAVGFDHGTQYFKATLPEFTEVVHAAEKVGALAPWNGRVVNLSYGVQDRHPAPHQRWVGVPGMASFSGYLAYGLTILKETWVQSFVRRDRQWALMLEQVDEATPKAYSEAFDWVVCAIPAEQAAQLLSEVYPEAAKLAARVQSSVTWTGLFTFDDPVPVDFDAAYVVDSPLGWISRDSSKPGRAPGERWVVDATTDWSKQHVDESPSWVAESLADVFQSIVGIYTEPTIAKAHRWLFSLPTNPLGQEALVDYQLKLAVCGDWVHKAEIQSAFESGRIAALQISDSASA